jgi:hypothetical protein
VDHQVLQEAQDHQVHPVIEEEFLIHLILQQLIQMDSFLQMVPLHFKLIKRMQVELL